MFNRREFLRVAELGSIGTFCAACSMLEDMDRGMYDAHEAIAQEDLITGQRVVGSIHVKNRALGEMARCGAKAFARFAAREGLEDPVLCEAVLRARRGLVDADLGGGVIKQRIARKGGGRSGGFRTIVLFRRGELAFFVYGFAKSDREDLRRDELETFRRLADEYLALDRAGLAAAVAVGAIVEVKCDDQTMQE